MKIIEPRQIIWKYEAVASYVFLAFQYIFILNYSDVSPDVQKQYVELWYYDISLLMPVFFFIFFPQKIRLILMLVIFIYGLIYFYTEMDFNSIYINTFLSLFLSYKYLLFHIDEKQKSRFVKTMFSKYIILFVVIFVAVLFEYLLEKLGMTHSEVRGDGKVMTNYGRFIFFGLYYGCLAYIEYRAVQKSGTES